MPTTCWAATREMDVDDAMWREESVAHLQVNTSSSAAMLTTEDQIDQEHGGASRVSHENWQDLPLHSCYPKGDCWHAG